MRRDLTRACKSCPYRTHLLACPACDEPTRGAALRTQGATPSRVPQLITFLLFLAVLLALPAFALYTLWATSVPPLGALAFVLLGSVVVLVALLVLGLIGASLAGASEGWRSGPRRLAFGEVGLALDGVTGVFGAVLRATKRVDDLFAPDGYKWGALALIGGTLTVVVRAFWVTDDLLSDALTSGVIVLGWIFAATSLIPTASDFMHPPHRRVDPAATREAALRRALRDRTDVEGRVELAGPGVTTPVGDSVIAYRIRGLLDGHEVDDADAADFTLTDSSGRRGLVRASGDVLVALDGEGELVDRSELDKEWLAARGLSSWSGSLRIHRLRDGDRVRVSADFERGGVGESSYRDAVAMTMVAGDEPIVLR